MTQRSKVPQFGNWESEDVPYTVFFEKARKGKKGGKMINPNDPQENPDKFPDIAPPAQAPPSRARTEPEEPIRRHATHNNDTGHGAVTESTHQRRGGHVKQSAGSEHSIEQSPQHPHYQGKNMRRVSGSSAGDGKNSYDGSQGTHGRPRMKPVSRGNESPDKGAAVPKFGDWDESDPSSADNYTHIFNKVRDERNSGSPKLSSMDTESSYNSRQKKIPDDSKMCCFPWCKK